MTNDFFLSIKANKWEKKFAFSANDVKTVKCTEKKNLIFNLIPYIKINSKSIINFSLKYKTKEKSIEENFMPQGQARTS